MSLDWIHWFWRRKIQSLMLIQWMMMKYCRTWALLTILNFESFYFWKPLLSPSRAMALAYGSAWGFARPKLPKAKPEPGPHITTSSTLMWGMAPSTSFTALVRRMLLTHSQNHCLVHAKRNLEAWWRWSVLKGECWRACQMHQNRYKCIISEAQVSLAECHHSCQKVLELFYFHSYSTCS
jgi:hypothetical protein